MLKSHLVLSKFLCWPDLSCEYVVIKSPFVGDSSPVMHVITFSDLDHFLGQLLFNSGDVTHRCTDGGVLLKVWLPTIICGAGALCRTKLPVVPLGFEKEESCTKKATMFLSFLLYIDNSGKLHVEWHTTEYGSLCYTMEAILALCPVQHEKKNWANYHSEGASETNLTGPYKDSPRVA